MLYFNISSYDKLSLYQKCIFLLYVEELYMYRAFLVVTPCINARSFDVLVEPTASIFRIEPEDRDISL
jgi:hypothetical protein